METPEYMKNDDYKYAANYRKDGDYLKPYGGEEFKADLESNEFHKEVSMDIFTDGVEITKEEYEAI